MSAENADESRAAVIDRRYNGSKCTTTAERFALTIQIDGGISHADSFAGISFVKGQEPHRECRRGFALRLSVWMFC